MNIHDAASITAVTPESLRDPAIVNAIIEQIRSGQSAGERRLMLRTLVERLIAADQPEAAAMAARVAPDLTPDTYVNDVDYWLPAELLLAVADRLLDRGHIERAVELIDEAALELRHLPRYDRFDLPVEEPWFQLTRRYQSTQRLDRITAVLEQAIAWARTLEQSPAIPDPHFFQPLDGSHYLARIAAELVRLGETKRAAELAAAIADPACRAAAVASVPATADTAPIV